MKASDGGVIVLVDLGNVHDCLQRLGPLAESGRVTVRAYADLCFNGFGISPPVCCDNVTVFKASSPDKNSADVQLIWDVAQLCQADTALRLVVATKDLGFRHLQALAAEAGHELTFVQDWGGLQATLLRLQIAEKSDGSWSGSMD